jgi:hypothetical protein
VAPSAFLVGALGACGNQQPAGLPILRAISAVTMKMPEPVIAPTTIMTES